MRPRFHLAVSLTLRDQPPASRLVVLLDQFEEVFTQCEDGTMRHAFIDNLLYAASKPDGQTVVVLTLRADFYGKCAFDPALAAALPDHQLLVGPLTEDELRSAIEQPAPPGGLRTRNRLDGYSASGCGAPGRCACRCCSLPCASCGSTATAHGQMPAAIALDAGGAGNDSGEAGRLHARPPHDRGGLDALLGAVQLEAHALLVDPGHAGAAGGR